MFKAIVGDRARPFFAVLVTGDDTPAPVDLSSSTCTFSMKAADGTTKVAAQAMTVHPTQTWTADTTNNRIAAADNKARNGDQVILSNSGGALPTPFAAATRYWVVNRNTANLQLSATPDGTPIVLTGSGTGTHSFYIVGSCQYPWVALDVDTAGSYGGFVQETVGGLVRTYPVDVDGIHRGFPIVISAL